MMTYGWTLADALELTLPQLRLLFVAISKYPPISMLAHGLLKSMEQDRKASTDGTIAAVQAAGAPIQVFSKEAMSKLLGELAQLKS